MARQTTEQRVEALELRVTRLDGEGGRLDTIESQIVQLRTQMHDGFSAIGTGMRDGFAELRAELRAEIRAGDEETRRFMRVLHEDLVSRIAAIQKG
jgi:hypothetical protein